MKVGTDGVLLGSWVTPKNPLNILDIGAGTGLLCLMMAQRFRNSKVIGVELNNNALKDALRNVNESAFADRVSIVHSKIQEYKTDLKFDLIICNPPFFHNSLNSSSSDRNNARHAVELTPKELLEISESLLNDNGQLSIVIPSDQLDAYRDQAKEIGLFLTKKTLVRGRADRPFKRCLLTFRKYEAACEQDELTIEQSRHVYTDDYIELTKPFYLAM